MEYVLGFVYENDKVVLIQKLRPKWMEYLWNGVGGKIKCGETPVQAMEREWQEEAGCECKDWDYRIKRVYSTDAVVHVFSSTNGMAFSAACRMTQEKVRRFHIGCLPCSVADVKWMVPLLNINTNFVEIKDV